MKLAEFPEAADEARRILPYRTERIENGRLNGRHWFHAMITEGRALAIRKNAWKGRRAVRNS